MYCSIRCNFRSQPPEILQTIKAYLIHVLNMMFRLESPKSRNDFYKEPAVFKKGDICKPLFYQDVAYFELLKTSFLDQTFKPKLQLNQNQILTFHAPETCRVVIKMIYLY